MTIADANACVVDTNVLVYGTVSGNPWYQQAREWLATLQLEGRELCITTQILREYLVVLTRGDVFEKSFSVDQVLAQVQALLPEFTVLDEPLDCVGTITHAGATTSSSRQGYSRCQYVFHRPLHLSRDAWAHRFRS